MLVSGRIVRGQHEITPGPAGIIADPTQLIAEGTSKLASVPSGGGGGGAAAAAGGAAAGGAAADAPAAEEKKEEEKEESDDDMVRRDHRAHAIHDADVDSGLRSVRLKREGIVHCVDYLRLMHYFHLARPHGQCSMDKCDGPPYLG